MSSSRKSYQTLLDELEAYTTLYGMDDSAIEGLRSLVDNFLRDETSVKSHPGIRRLHSTSASVASLPAFSDDAIPVAGDSLPSGAWLEVSASSPELPAHLFEANNPATIDLSRGSPSLHKDIWSEQEELLRFQDGNRTSEERYQFLSVLGEGAMGEVWQVWDWELKRIVAMKVLRAEELPQPRFLNRFLAEARITAQLEHPSIVPVYELGQLEDGRFYFTMKEVKGQTLSKVIKEVHLASQQGRWEVSDNGWSLRRLIDVFKRVCEAVGYAHSRGIMHRDLKPSNIMVGAHGEVYVMDWGLVKQQTTEGESWVELDEADSDSFETLHTTQTRLGTVKGTPAFMPPEQARGENNCLDPRSDVYALGAILYNILSGRVPYTGKSEEVLEQVVEGPPLSLRERSRWKLSRSGRYAFPPLPEELLDACELAMSREQEERYANGDELAQVIDHWLDDIQKQDRVLAMVERARYLASEAQTQGIRAGIVRKKARNMLESIPHWEEEPKKWPGWEHEQLAHQLEMGSVEKQLEADQLLKAALMIVPDLEEAHAVLASHYRKQHQRAEKEHQLNEARAAEQGLRHHLRFLSPQHENFQELTHYLQRQGQLTLVTEPSGVETTLYVFEEMRRRLQAVHFSFPGTTPLRNIILPPGSYLLELHHQGQEVRYPFLLNRGEHWDISEEASVAQVLKLDVGPLTAEECYIPAGWFWSGSSDVDEEQDLQGKLWLDGFVMQKFQVTNETYLEFLNDLLEQNREEEALLYAPRERSNLKGQDGTMIYGRDEKERFCLVPDADGDIWELDWPVFMIDWNSARAYADWWGEQTGQPWRLPLEVEWEKAARGVDGRIYPWGNGFDPSRCCVRFSHPGRPLPVSVTAFPSDESVYGVRGMAGNVRDWCLDLAEDALLAWKLPKVEVKALVERFTPTEPATVVMEPHMRSTRGGAWDARSDAARLDRRMFNVHSARFFNLGFRLVRPVE